MIAWLRRLYVLRRGISARVPSSSKVTRTARELTKPAMAPLGRLRRSARTWIAGYVRRLAPSERVPGPRGEHHITRYWLIKTKRLQLVLHNWLTSDSPDLHDHAWWNVTIVLRGKFIEHTEHGPIYLRAGDVVFRRPTVLHRLEINEPIWTLFLTGPTVREWGFMTRRGWRPWQRYIP